MKLKLVPILLTIFVIAGCDRRQEIAKLTSDAADAIAETNYDREIKDYSEVIRLDPKFTDAYVARAAAFEMLHKYDEAVEDANEGIRLEPTNYFAHKIRGIAFLERRRFDKAISDFSIVLEDKTTNAKSRGNAYKFRGLAYYWDRSFTNAIADLTEASKYLPDDYFIYEIRGDCYGLKTNSDKALNDFNKAIQLNPEDVGALYSRGRVYFRIDEYTNAAHDFDKAIQLRPQTYGAYNLLAWLLATCPEDSIRDGKRAVELATQACDMTKWTNYACVDTLAAAYAETGDFE